MDNDIHSADDGFDDAEYEDDDDFNLEKMIDGDNDDIDAKPRPYNIANIGLQPVIRPEMSTRDISAMHMAIAVK